MPSQTIPAGRPVVVHLPVYLRLVSWVSFVVCVLAAFVGVSAGLSGQPVLGAVLIVVGLGLAVMLWFCARLRVRCDHKGIHQHAFRATFIPAAEIDRLTVISSPRRAPALLAVATVTLTRKDGSTVSLAAYTLRMSQRAADARMHALTKRMQAAIGLPPSSSQPSGYSVSPEGY